MSQKKCLKVPVSDVGTGTRIFHVLDNVITRHAVICFWSIILPKSIFYVSDRVWLKMHEKLWNFCLIIFFFN